jgi:hypothetical protein
MPRLRCRAVRRDHDDAESKKPATDNVAIDADGNLVGLA